MTISPLAILAADPDALVLIERGNVYRARDLGAAVRSALGALRRLERARPGGWARGIAIDARRDLSTIAMIYALIESGIPILSLDSRLPGAARERLLAELSLPLLGGDWMRGERLVLEGEAVVDREEAMLTFRDSAGDAPCAEAGGLPRGGPSRALAMLETSGTTGVSRCALLGPEAFRASAHATDLRLGRVPGDRWLLSLPFSHVGGFAIVIRSLLTKKAIVSIGETRPFDPEAIIRAIDRDRITLLSLVPTMLHGLLRRTPAWRPHGGVRAILVGGAPVSPSLLLESRERGLPVLVTYGLTEACSQVSSVRPGTPPDPSEGCGPPIEGIELRIAKSEIQIRGPSMMLGYASRGGVRRPFLEGGWFGTGDEGYLDEVGRLHVSGRRKDLIITGGEKVSPPSVESVLERFPGVLAACVFGLPDPLWGETVAAALLVDRGSSFDLASLSRFASRELAPHARPRHVSLLDRFFENDRGKRDRAKIEIEARSRLTALPGPGAIRGVRGRSGAS